MQDDPFDPELLPQMSPLDDLGVYEGVSAVLRRFARSVFLAVIIVAVFAIIGYFLLYFCDVAYAMAFGDVPWHESEVLR
jgi:hypothetical protein